MLKDFKKSLLKHGIKLSGLHYEEIYELPKDERTHLLMNFIKTFRKHVKVEMETDGIGYPRLIIKSAKSKKED